MQTDKQQLPHYKFADSRFTVAPREKFFALFFLSFLFCHDCLQYIEDITTIINVKFSGIAVSIVGVKFYWGTREVERE